MKSRLLLLLGPELLWAVFYGVASALAGRNTPPNEAGNASLERLCYIGAFLATALCFTVFLLPAAHRGWLLGRLIVATLIGVNLCLARLVGAVNYNDTRNSGTWGIWFYGLLASGAALVPGIVAVLIWMSRVGRLNEP